MNLTEFLNSKIKNCYVDEENISIYMRHSFRYINNEFLYCIDVANVVVHPDFMNQGIFTNFMNRLLIETNHSIYVESILNDKVNRICLKLGFEKYGDDNMILKR